MTDMTLTVERTEPQGEPNAELFERAEQLLRETEQADEKPPISDGARMAAKLGKRTLSVFSLDDQVVAVSIVGEGELDLAVHPTARKGGIGTQALAQSLALHRSDESLKSWVHGENRAAAKMLEGAGFTPARTLLYMTLDPALLPAPQAHTQLPEGFVLAPYDPENGSHASEVVEVNALAFASHPEQGDLTVAGFIALTKEPWFDADGLRLCRTSAGDLAGFTWLKQTEDDDGRAEAELYVLAVHPKFVGKGLGSSLLAVTLADMAALDPKTVSLYVEADNAPARALYERVGFVIARKSQQWLRPGARIEQ